MATASGHDFLMPFVSAVTSKKSGFLYDISLIVFKVFIKLIFIQVRDIIYPTLTGNFQVVMVFAVVYLCLYPLCYSHHSFL